MNPARTAKLISYFQSGIVTGVEVANSLIYELVSETKIDTDFLSTFHSLPIQVKQAFLELLHSVREANFHWTPFFITSKQLPADPTKYSEMLKQVYAFLKKAGID